MPNSRELALDLADVRARLSYDAETGKLVWLRAFHSSRVGKEAGFPNRFGYLIVGLHRSTFFAHRLAWFIHYGRWPSIEIDHIDRNPLNNMLANLRECTKRQNLANRAVFKRSATGLKGVCFAKKCGRFQTQIRVNGKMKWLGYYDTAQEAAEVYRAEAARIYGDFACP